ncbi:MAG TPA: porin, partial [Longimicrobiales bacterium]|nr:porin [Longimicrobiales bacterium]
MPTRNRSRTVPPTPILLLTLALLGAPGRLGAQAVEPREPVERTEIGGRVHFQMNTTSVDSEQRSELLVRRARIWVATRFNDWIDGVVLVDVAGEHAAARYAFVRFSPSEKARVSFGQFKRAFDLFELTPSSQILVVERDGNVRGAGPCAGVGGVCSYSRFSERLQLSSLDVGILVEGKLAGGELGYLVSVTNGAGPNRREENDAKSVSGRVQWTPWSRLTLGANASVHDYPSTITSTDRHAPSVAFDV